MCKRKIRNLNPEFETNSEIQYLNYLCHSALGTKSRFFFLKLDSISDLVFRIQDFRFR